MAIQDTLTALQSAIEDIDRVTKNGTAKRIVILMDEYLAELADRMDFQRCGHKERDYGCGDWLPAEELNDGSFCRFCAREHRLAAADDKINQDFYRDGRNRN